MSRTVTVKIGKSSVEVHLDSDGTTEDVKRVVEERTGVVARKQKLMFKGKVLLDGETLEAAGIRDGAKIMGIATEATQTQGQAMRARVDVAQRLAIARERMQNRRRAIEQGPQRTREDEVKNWTTTKIIACRDLALEAVPEHVLETIPAEISRLAQLRKLDLRHNRLNAQGLAPSLGDLCSLQQLYLDHNLLEDLPFTLHNFVTLEKLTLSNNALKILPDDFHRLQSLTELDLSENALTSLPTSLGQCMKLKVLNVNNNRLTDIPKSFSSLTELQTLRADNNRIDHVRSSLLKDCHSLSMLSLHSNPIVMHRFREIDGFLDYERRRQRQYDKKLHTGAMQPGEHFDEGADHAPSR